MSISRKRSAAGPTAVGFDEYFGISASLDMPPFIFIHNDRTVGAADGEEEVGCAKDRRAADFEAVDVLPMITAKAVEYIGGAREGGEALLHVLSAQRAACAAGAVEGVRG